MMNSTSAFLGTASWALILRSSLSPSLKRKSRSVSGQLSSSSLLWPATGVGTFATASGKRDDDESDKIEWRKKQLDKLENKFRQPSGDNTALLTTAIIDREEDLQPMWQAMERRVKNRRSLTVDECGGIEKVGRRNVRKTDEDLWLQEGLYEGNEDDDDAGEEVISRRK